MRVRPAAQVTAAAILVFGLLSVILPHQVPLGTVLYGVLYGSLNGLLAVGLVLIYRVSRSINFAYGAMGGLPAGIGASLYLSHHIPWALAILIAAVLGVAVGAAVGALINWRFSQSPRLVLTVASIGLAQLLGGIALFVPRYFHGPGLITSFRTGLSSWHGEINPVLFSGNDLLVVIAVPLVVAGTAWFLLCTDAGRAVRAIADNDERARLVGIPTRRLMLGVWGVSGLVAGLAVILQAPSAGVPLDAAAGPAILLPPLAAAVIARMDSLSLAFGAGIGLGVLESVVRLDISKQSIETPVFLVVILVALLLQRRSYSRADSADESSWSAAGALQPIPERLARLPEVRAARALLWAALAAVALLLPVSVGPARLYQVTVGLVFGVTALSLVMLSGSSGTVSLGQLALVGVGSITAGDMILHYNLDFFLSLVAACAAGAVAAVVLGLPALRVKGLYLAVTTLAFAVAANDFFFNPTNFGKELPASIVKPVLIKRFPLIGGSDLYFLALAVLLLAVVLTRQIRLGRPGRAILATRDNARAAEACAVGTTRTRLMTFAVAGMLAGAAGAVYVVTLGGVGYQTFQPTESITVFSMVVIGRDLLDLRLAGRGRADPVDRHRVPQGPAPPDRGGAAGGADGVPFGPGRPLPEAAGPGPVGGGPPARHRHGRVGRGHHGPGRGRHGRGAGDGGPRSGRRRSGRRRAQLPGGQRLLRLDAGPLRCRPRRPGRGDPGPPRHQRGRQVDPPQDGDGAHAVQIGPGGAGQDRRELGQHRADGRLRSGDDAGRPGGVPVAHRRGEPEGGLLAAAARPGGGR